MDQEKTKKIIIAAVVAVALILVVVIAAVMSRSPAKEEKEPPQVSADRPTPKRPDVDPNRREELRKQFEQKTPTKDPIIRENFNQWFGELAKAQQEVNKVNDELTKAQQEGNKEKVDLLKTQQEACKKKIMELLEKIRQERQRINRSKETGSQ